MSTHHRPRHGGGGTPPATPPAPAPRPVGHPIFAQPAPTADPTTFTVTHPSDAAAYAEIAKLNAQGLIKPLPFPAPRGGVEPTLTLDQVFGGNPVAIGNITSQGQIVFHALGDCGSARGPTTQNQVTDKLVSDFQDHAIETPQFALLLGDIIYNFGEAQYYYDQFYDPYRDYSAPVLAVAGNHDGMVSPFAHVATLEAYLRNFCADTFEVAPEAGALSRTAQIQPGVFFTLEAPFVRILVLYSNMLEDPGVIQNADIGDSQIQFLRAALARVKAENYQGALLFAHHHPAYTYSATSRHGWSVQMLADMDAVCTEVGVWPHAVLAGHVHNYQRFTRTRPDGSHIPYVACGNGGHNVLPLGRRGQPGPRVPQVLQPAAAGVDQVTFENYDDINYGYLRVIADPKQLRIEYHAASDGPGVKSPDDAVTIDLATRQTTAYLANDLGHPAEAMAIRRLRMGA